MAVTRPKLDGGQIQGTFRLHHDLNGILSKRIGGACLISDFAHLMTDEKVVLTEGVHARACTEKLDCNPKSTLDPATGNRIWQKWEGYCIKDDASGQKTCWYRPGDPPRRQLCNISSFHSPAPGTPWPLDKVQTVPLDNGFNLQGFYDRYTGGRPADWRVSGRLLGTKPGTQIDVFSDQWCLAAPGGKQC